MPLDGNPTDFETVTKTEVFSGRGLVAWLETQDPATQYDFGCLDGGCLIGRYLLATTGRMWKGHGLTWEKICDRYPALNKIAVTRPHTYGDALSRARHLLSQS